MAVLVTRPHPDDEATAASLRARGFEVLLAPMLRFEPVAFHDDGDARYGAVIVTSANALRGIEPHLKGSRLLELPLFAVGEHTASAARRAGFENVIPANGDAAALARSRARKRQGEGAEESEPAALSCRRRSGAGSGRRTRRTRLHRRHPHHLPDGRRSPACRAKPATPSPPTGSRRCCIIRGAARAHSWRRRAPPASKYRRWRSRNAASPMALPRWSATPGPRRSWWRPRRMKMPCSGRWTVLCALYRAKRDCRIR